MTALMIASFLCRESVVKELLGNGASMDVQTENGRTALMIASQKGHEAVVKALLGKGARLDVQEKDG